MVLDGFFCRSPGDGERSVVGIGMIISVLRIRICGCCLRIRTVEDEGVDGERGGIIAALVIAGTRCGNVRDNDILALFSYKGYVRHAAGRWSHGSVGLCDAFLLLGTVDVYVELRCIEAIVVVMISHQRVLAGAQPLEGDVEADGTFGYLWGVTVFVTIDGKAVGDEFRTAESVFKPA